MNTHSPALTNPSGTISADSATLWWILIATAVIVFVIVMAILFVGLFRKRSPLDAIEPRPSARAGGRGGLKVVIGGGIVIPALVLFVDRDITTQRRGVAGGSVVGGAQTLVISPRRPRLRQPVARGRPRPTERWRESARDSVD